jgi:galactose mutarotase-like enzyme
MRYYAPQMTDAVPAVDGNDLEIRGEHARFVIRPSRGGMLTAFEVDGTRVLYMDDGSLEDLSRHVRGGVPVLFPTPGKLEADTWHYDNMRGSLPQHGFARDLPWRVVRTDRTTVVLELVSTPATREQFPWDFSLELSYALHGTTLRIEQRVANTSDAAMPFGFGFHPYLYVREADKPKVRVATAASRAYDNVTKQNVALSGIDLTKPEVDLHLLDHDATASALSTPAGEIRVRGSSEYLYWVVWTLAGREFVCLEPWTCPRNALNTGEHLIVVPPGESRQLWIELAFSPK